MTRRTLVCGLFNAMRNRPIRLVALFLLVVSLTAFAVAVWDVTQGGFYFTVFGIRVSSWEAYKPFRLAVFALMVTICLYEAATPTNTLWDGVPRAAPFVAAVAGLAAICIAVTYGIFAAGGSDAYGYVSEAQSIAAGHLRVPNTLIEVTPILGDTVAPLGYHLSPDKLWLIPAYPVGLPALMALALLLGGLPAVYYVVPALAGVTAWSTYLLGARVTDRRTAMLASILTTFSPIVVFQSLEPMSDVPAMAFWTLALAYSVSRGREAPYISGLAVAVAVMIRPNLAPLIVPLACMTFLNTRVDRVNRVGVFVAMSSLGFIAVGLVNRLLYGSALRTGYGDVSTMYSWTHFEPNVRKYFTWLTDLHTPVVLLAFVAPFVSRIKYAWWMLSFISLVIVSYLFYLVFDNWPFLRFLLPALPLLIILSSSVLLRLIGVLPEVTRTAALVLLCTILPGYYLETARGLNVFFIQLAESRYPVVGTAVGRQLPSDAVVLTVLQSGSIRLYGGRPTVRWDLLESNRLDLALNTLSEKGYEAYLALEEWEEQPFRDYFSGASVFGRLDWPPAMQYYGTSFTRIYSIADRARYSSGIAIETKHLTRQ